MPAKTTALSTSWCRGNKSKSRRPEPSVAVACYLPLHTPPHPRVEGGFWDALHSTGDCVVSSTSIPEEEEGIFIQRLLFSMGVWQNSDVRREGATASRVPSTHWRESTWERFCFVCDDLVNPPNIQQRRHRLSCACLEDAGGERKGGRREFQK